MDSLHIYTRHVNPRCIEVNRVLLRLKFKMANMAAILFFLNPFLVISQSIFDLGFRNSVCKYIFAWSIRMHCIYLSMTPSITYFLPIFRSTWALSFVCLLIHTIQDAIYVRLTWNLHITCISVMARTLLIFIKIAYRGLPKERPPERAPIMTSV